MEENKRRETSESRENNLENKNSGMRRAAETETGMGGRSGAAKKNGRWQYPLLLVLVICLGLALGAGGYWALNIRENSKGAGEAAGEKAATSIPLLPEVPATVACPLCGEELNKLPGGRPLAVIIDNLPGARPQSGLADAEVVYECPVEGGLTRLLAVFYHQTPGKVGPIRSARPYFLTLAQELQAVLVHCGGSPESLETIEKQGLFTLDEIKNAAVFWRSAERREPNNLYSSGSELRAAVQAKGANKSVKFSSWRFASAKEKPSSGEAALQVTIKYGTAGSEVKFVYSADANKYLRYNGGQPHRDAESGEQLAAANVVVQFADGQVQDAEGRLSLGITGSGRAVVFTGGQRIEAVWSKAGAGQRTVYKTAQGGKEIVFTPGPTWVEIVTSGTRVE